MPSTIFSAVCIGMQVVPVTVEAALGQGFSGLQFIGLPQDYARDARERIRSSLESLGVSLPARRLVVSVRPSETLKLFKGGLEHLDLPCAIAILAALADSPSESKKNAGLLNAIALNLKEGTHLFAGQLTLSGRLLVPEYILPFELLLLETGSAAAKVWSATVPSKISRAPKKHFIHVESLKDCLHALSQNNRLNRTDSDSAADEAELSGVSQSATNATAASAGSNVDANSENQIHKIISFFEKFSSTPSVAAVLAVAAAGRHHILFAGSPGCGKTFALRHLSDLLPPLSHREQLEVALIRQRDPCPTDSRPFRHPHHSASAAALLGGSLLQPGEVSLAHHGLLFLDELAEFPRPALEALREPLDERKITLSRARGRIELPADFLLASATNPCSCGFFFSRTQSCRCAGNAPLKYQQKLSGPLLERFSLLLLMDELLDDDQRTAGSDSASPLAELAHGWQQAFNRAPEQWAHQFVKVQNELWSSTPVYPAGTLPETLLLLLETQAKSQKLSSRTLFHLKKLLVTLTSLFPEQISSWNCHKTLASVQQLRSLESALRKGASFLAPTEQHSFLKNSGKEPDSFA